MCAVCNLFLFSKPVQCMILLKQEKNVFPVINFFLFFGLMAKWLLNHSILFPTNYFSVFLYRFIISFFFFLFISFFFVCYITFALIMNFFYGHCNEAVCDSQYLCHFLCIGQDDWNIFDIINQGVHRPFIRYHRTTLVDCDGV